MSLVFVSFLNNLPERINEWLVRHYVDEIRWRNALMTQVLNQGFEIVSEDVHTLLKDSEASLL